MQNLKTIINRPGELSEFMEDWFDIKGDPQGVLSLASSVLIERNKEGKIVSVGVYANESPESEDVALAKFRKNDLGEIVTTEKHGEKIPSLREKIEDSIDYDRLEEDGIPAPTFYEGLDDALIGLTEEQSENPSIVIYDHDRIIEILMKRDNMSQEDALDFFDINIIGMHVGETTPLFVKRETESLFDYSS